MGALAPILLIAQTAAKIAATNQQAHQARDMYNAKAKIQENNAAIEKIKASQAADRSAKEEKKIVDRGRIVAARNRAAGGASNVENVGSLRDVNNAVADEVTTELTTSLLNQRNNTFLHRTNERTALANAENLYTAGRNVIHQAHAANAATILGMVASAYGQGMFGKSSSSSSSSSSASDWNGSAPYDSSDWLKQENASYGNFGHDYGYGADYGYGYTNNRTNWRKDVSYGYYK